MSSTRETIDLRSDTLTLPSEAMKQAMVTSPLGDDMIDVDPTVEQLQADLARVLRKEAALFMPSGTMTNQIALRVHCQPGDEFICDDQAHIYHYEQGAFAQLSGLSVRPLAGNCGCLEPEAIVDAIRPPGLHTVTTRLLCLENTHNRGGGTVIPLDLCAELCETARSHGLATHLDGARLFNAVVASGVAAHEFAALFDTVSVCFSKGLGAPVGSALAGSREAIEKARRYRKLFGGAMRQAGVLAGAALYALHHNVERLAEDHRTAALLAECVRRSPHLTLEPERVETNIVIFRVAEAWGGDAARFVARLEEQGVRSFPFSRRHVRLVTHMHISTDDALKAGEIVERIARERA
ncbi:MAG: GntG family PLP-dependent aldolase [Pirellulaceae bacterium]